MKFHVEKNITIKADKAKVRSFIDDFAKWTTWSPWNVLEPRSEVKTEGEAGRVGHTMHWNGEIIGSGKMEVTKVDETGNDYALEFFGPMKSKATSAFRLNEKDGATEVTWLMDGNMPFFLFFLKDMMANWVGMDYDRGLRMLREIVETGEIKAKIENKGVVDYEGFNYIGIKRTCPVSEMPTLMAKDFEKIVDDVVKKNGLAAQHWITVYEKWDMKNMNCTYISAVSDENLKDVDLGADYVKGSIQSGKALEVKHHGSYEFLGNAWSMAMMYVRAKKMKTAKYPFEQYWNSPIETKPDDLETSIFFPLK